MHDPMTVAHVIPRPWPQKTSFPSTGSRGDGVRWRIRLNHQHTDYCRDNDPPHKAGPFPWWRARSYSRFWRVAGRDVYWPPLITIWHIEPGGADGLTVCRDRKRDRHGKWKFSSGWKWHLLHWKFQVHPAQNFRRWLLTRCEWCHGRPAKGDPVNVSHQWGGTRSPWWRGERGLYHHGCSIVEHAHRLCLCDFPDIPSHLTYGRCQTCGRFRPHGDGPGQADRILAALPHGARLDDDTRAKCTPYWDAMRAKREAERS